MRITTLDRLSVNRDLADTRADSRLCYLCIPLLIADNQDLDSFSADNITDGNGLGAIDGEWHIYALRVHFRNVDTSLMTFGHVPPGVDLGDALINFSPRDLAAVNQSLADENSYLLIDGDTFHVISMLPTGLGRIEEWSADCRRFNPKFRATGY